MEAKCPRDATSELIDLLEDYSSWKNTAIGNKIKEVKEILLLELQSAWEETGLLDGLSEETKKNCTIALEAQRLYNENDISTTKAFRRISIPLIRRLFINKNLKGFFQHDKSSACWDGECQLQCSTIVPEWVKKDGDVNFDKEIEDIIPLAESLSKELKDFSAFSHIELQNDNFYVIVKT